MIGRNGERRSGISAQAARHDDDDDIYIYVCVCSCIEKQLEIFIRIPGAKQFK